MFAAVRTALSAASRSSFQVVHFSVQRDHLHLLIEADDAASLSSGANGLSVRCAKAINRAAGRRGSVWADRYDCKTKDNPTLVRIALNYLFSNIKKHDPSQAPLVDHCSSAPWFEGFRERFLRPCIPSPVRSARTWLVREGWLKAGGPLSIHEGPAQAA
jgi:hypothetical protein